MTVSNYGLIQVLLLDLAALATIFGYFYMRDKNKQDRIEDRFQRVDDKLNDLSVACVRRDEVKDMLSPVRHDIKEIRSRLDELFKQLSRLPLDNP